MTSGQVWTASWRAAIDAEPAVQPVRISVGKPRWIAGERAVAYPLVEGLAPFGLLGLDPVQFRARYRERLDRYADEIARDLATLRAATDRPLLLCCFEADPADCHRGIVAAWWLDQTGEAIPEWVKSERSDQLSLTEEER